MTSLARPIDELLARFEASYALLLADDEKRHFHGLYLRNTRAVKAEIDRGGFLDAEWVGRWVVAFANRYLDALEEWERAGTSPGPWQLAFEAARDPAIPPLRHQLVGLNAHLNFDLPRALLAVMSDGDWADPALVARRHTDFAHIDTIVIRRVPEEYRKLCSPWNPPATARSSTACSTPSTWSPAPGGYAKPAARYGATPSCSSMPGNRIPPRSTPAFASSSSAHERGWRNSSPPARCSTPAFAAHAVALVALPSSNVRS